MAETETTQKVASPHVSGEVIPEEVKKELSQKYFRDFDFALLDTSLEALLKAGVHFGHLKSRRHPKMDPFIFTTRKNISIVNLEKTKECLDEAVAFLQGVKRSGKPILFAGIKKQTHDAVRSLAERLESPFVIDRWLGGTLTNFSCIRDRAKYLSETEVQFGQGEFKKYTKLERQKISEELEKLDRKVGGLRGMSVLPGVIVIADGKEGGLIIKEAVKMGVPIVAITDTNADPSEIDYPIPGNDDALSSLRILLAAIGKGLLEVKTPAQAAEKK